MTLLLFLTVNIPNLTKSQKSLSYTKTYVSCDIYIYIFNQYFHAAIEMLSPFHNIYTL